MSVTPASLDEFATMETREASPSHFLIKFDSFYNSGIKKYETNEFVAGEYKWRLIIYPNGDDYNSVGESDYVSVYLSMSDTSSLPANWEVNAVFSISIFNHISVNYLSSLGRTRRLLGMMPRCGLSKFISKKFFSDPSNGYLVNDTCVFGAEVFIVKKEAAIQCLSLKNFETPYKNDWKISKFSQLGNVWVSEEFTGGGHKWKVHLYTKGNNKGDGKDVSIYLYYRGSESVNASYTIWIKNQVSVEHKKLTASQVFSPSDNNWGWRSFIEIATINDPKKGFIVNDCCLLHIEISSVQVVA